MRISDWSSDVCSSDLVRPGSNARAVAQGPTMPCSSTGSSFDRRGQRLVRPEAIGPCLDRLMVDHPTGMDILQGFERHPVTLLLLIDPGGQRLFHHPTARAFEPGGHCFNLFRERQEHPSELQSLMRISYAVFCLKK